MKRALGHEPSGAAFDALAMRLFGEWAQHDIAAGEALFNTAPLLITTVRGLNDDATVGTPHVIPGTCTTCHDTPNVGGE